MIAAQRSLATTQQSLAAHQCTITEQNAFIADQASCITEQTASIEQLQQIGESLSQSLIRTTAELKRSEGIRLAVLNSRFWRMTSPLRWISTQAKAILFSRLWGRVLRILKLLLQEGHPASVAVSSINRSAIPPKVTSIETGHARTAQFPKAAWHNWAPRLQAGATGH
ncbi:hypothetical protein [Rhodoferax sp. AJA081-3]|uniref:hypothetical protein n=1 Tax=Rhodoferax sp. AJA081-3 TaxID=2752316 RepID=UPI001ADF6D65|nr:hypothetical protein [Rhodoferax sp. AJA081-3]